MSRQPLRVLIVEDNPGDLELVSDRLVEVPHTSFRIRTAKTLAEATSLLGAEPVDAILLDLNLPDSQGIDTLRRVKAIGADAPVLIVSGHVDEKSRTLALEKGADEVFGKDESNTRLFSRSVLYIIERSRARLEQRELERALAAIPDAIVVVNISGEVMYVNQAALALFGRTREDFIGELLGFSVGEGAASEVTILRRDAQRQCEMRVVQVEWARERALLASLRDVTAQRNMETQLALSDRMVAIGTLAAGVGHEINNPLTAVMANLEMAIQELGDSPNLGAGSADLMDELRDAREAAERIRQIVRDLTMFSRSEDEKRGPVDIHRVIDSTARMAWNEIRHRARLVKDYGKVPPVDASEAKVGQVILNLLVNAAQAIPEGDQSGNEIRISTGTNLSGSVVVTIADTGAGIAPEIQKRLFTAFFTTKPVGVGTGLGLAISRRIITSFGGEISFESVVGKGTKFAITLPPAAPTEKRVESPASLDTTKKRRARVLVIDDEAPIVAAFRRFLGSEHDVTVVESARSGLSLISDSHPFDIIFCDLMMPQMNGVEFHSAVKKLSDGLAERIVFMTGGAFTPATGAFLEKVRNPYVEKPFDLQRIRKMVHEIVGAAS